jgi:hypothetical protein
LFTHYSSVANLNDTATRTFKRYGSINDQSHRHFDANMQIVNRFFLKIFISLSR